MPVSWATTAAARVARRTSQLALAAASLMFCAAVQAQGFPSRPILMTVGFAPSGGTDTAARIIARKLSDNLGQQVVVENKAGAGGNIAADHIAKAAPDGHSISLAAMGPLVVAPVEAVRATLDLNVVGTFLCLKHAAPHLSASGRGSFVGMSSHAGRDTFRFLGVYGAAKAGLDMLIRVAADELGAAGVRVNSMLPGVISTELMSVITDGSPVLDSYLEEIPLGRVGEPADVAALARFLIGPESSWITGQNLSVDGGQSVRKGADYSSFARGTYGTDPRWALVEPPA